MKRMYIVFSFFLFGSVLVSCGSSKISSSPSPGNSPEMKSPDDDTAEKFVPWNDELVASFAHQKHDSTNYRVSISTPLFLSLKQTNDNLVRQAIFTETEKIVGTVPVGTPGFIEKRFRSGNDTYVKVPLTLQNGTIVKVFFKRKKNSKTGAMEYEVCTNERDATKNTAEAILKTGSTFFMSIRADQKCILMGVQKKNNTTIDIGEDPKK